MTISRLRDANPFRLYNIQIIISTFTKKPTAERKLGVKSRRSDISFREQLVLAGSEREREFKLELEQSLFHARAGATPFQNHILLKQDSRP